MGIVKAYTTRVGEGPFPTELLDDTGTLLRDKGGEYGTTTNRPRRCGWLDMVMLRTAARLNGITHIAVTKLDVLNGMDEIQVATGYRTEDGLLSDFPTDLATLTNCQPEYRSFPGWSDYTQEGIATMVAQGYDALPSEMRDYLEYIAHEMGAELEIISLGPEREMTIRR
jgi:adenylosuccinate synthase